AREHALGEILGDRRPLAGEPPYEGRRVVPALERERGQADRSDPALGVAVELGERVLVERDAVLAANQRRGLGDVEAELVGADLAELARDAEAGEAEIGDGPAGDDDGASGLEPR